LSTGRWPPPAGRDARLPGRHPSGWADGPSPGPTSVANHTILLIPATRDAILESRGAERTLTAQVCRRHRQYGSNVPFCGVGDSTLRNTRPPAGTAARDPGPGSIMREPGHGAASPARPSRTQSRTHRGQARGNRPEGHRRSRMPRRMRRNGPRTSPTQALTPGPAGPCTHRDQTRPRNRGKGLPEGHAVEADQLRSPARWLRNAPSTDTPQCQPLT